MANKKPVFNGREMKRRRRQQGWSRSDLAKYSGVGERTIINMEQGGTEPRGCNVMAVARELGSSAEDLYRFPKRRAPKPRAAKRKAVRGGA